VFERQDAPDDPWAVELWLSDGRIDVEFTDVAAFEIDSRSVDLVLDDADDPDMLVHLLLDHVLPRVIALRGDLMLHAAGAVDPAGVGHVFLGGTGQGKSTLSVALAAMGWGLLDDDGIRVTKVDGVPHAVPGYSVARLLPDAIAGVLPTVEPGLPMAAGHPKRRVAVDGDLGMAMSPAPVAHAYVLQRTESPTPSVVPLSLRDAVDAVVRHGFHLDHDHGAVLRRTFEQASGFAATVPVSTLHVPHGLHRLAEVAALIDTSPT